ncbi:MAG: hypothetical protein ACRCSE_10565 [Vibrio sp.]
MYTKIKDRDDTALPRKFNPSGCDAPALLFEASFLYDQAFHMTEKANSRKMRAIVSRHRGGEAKTPMTDEISDDTFN